MTYPEYVERVKKLLERIEWVEESYVNRFCPACDHDERDGATHEAGCELDLLRKVVLE